MRTAQIFLASLAAFAGLLAGRLASTGEAWYADASEDAIEAGRVFVEKWRART